jgi:hypothetical protein
MDIIASTPPETAEELVRAFLYFSSGLGLGAVAGIRWARHHYMLRKAKRNGG